MTRPAAKIRLFVTESLQAGVSLILTDADAHYLANVMRCRVGDNILIFNGCDGEWLAKIVALPKKSVHLETIENTREQTIEPDLWLVFAPIKKGRIDYLAEKATELGVSKLIPVKTERTVVSRIKASRLLANAREASEQCERLTVPDVVEMDNLKNVLAGWPKDRALVFCDELKGDPSLLDVLKSQTKNQPWAILIGPEGGFSESERKLIRSFPYCIPASLGPRVLRADTAAFAAIALWQATLGDWGKKNT